LAPRAHDAIEADKGHRTHLADVDRIVEARQVSGIERNDNDARERTIRADDPARQLDRPFVRHAPENRLADEEKVLGALGMNAEMLAIVQIHSLEILIKIASQHDPVPADDHDLEREIGQELAVPGPEGNIEILQISLA
jgi:hypothetical protein